MEAVKYIRLECERGPFCPNLGNEDVKEEYARYARSVAGEVEGVEGVDGRERRHVRRWSS